MIEDHDIEVHLAYWKNAIQGNLKSGSDPLRTIAESADQIKELLKDSAKIARTKIDAAAKLSVAYLQGGSEESPSKEVVLEAIQSVHTAIRADDIDKIKSALRPPLPTRRPS